MFHVRDDSRERVVAKDFADHAAALEWAQGAADAALQGLYVVSEAHGVICDRVLPSASALEAAAAAAAARELAALEAAHAAQAKAQADQDARDAAERQRAHDLAEGQRTAQAIADAKRVAEHHAQIAAATRLPGQAPDDHEGHR